MRGSALKFYRPTDVSSQCLLAPTEVLAEDTSTSRLASGLLPAFGRLLLGISGAYFLRAITEAHLIPQLAGTIAGLLYAAAWLLVFLRIVPPDRLIVILQGITASLIAGPLVWEATVRFHSLSPAAAASALAIFIVLGQGIGSLPRLSLISGITPLAGSATAIALIIATLDPIPFAIAVTATAAVVELYAWGDRALNMRWITVVAADFGAFLLIYVRTRPQGLPEGYAPVPVAIVSAMRIALVITYACSTAIRTLVRRLPVGSFEIAQVAAAVSLTIAGSVQILHLGVFAGAVCLVVAAICYLIAFTNVSGRAVIGRNFHVYATFGLLLAVFGGILSFSATVLGFVWPLLAFSAIWRGEHKNESTLSAHGDIYFFAGASTSGLIIYAIGSMMRGSESQLNDDRDTLHVSNDRRVPPNAQKQKRLVETANLSRDSCLAAVLERVRAVSRFAVKGSERYRAGYYSSHGAHLPDRPRTRLGWPLTEHPRTDLAFVSMDGLRCSEAPRRRLPPRSCGYHVLVASAVRCNIDRSAMLVALGKVLKRFVRLIVSLALLRNGPSTSKVRTNTR